MPSRQWASRFPSRSNSGAMKPLVAASAAIAILLLIAACSNAVPGRSSSPSTVAAASTSLIEEPTALPSARRTLLPSSAATGAATGAPTVGTGLLTAPPPYVPLRCDGRPGLGDFDHPFVLGDIDGSTVALDCPPLALGDPLTDHRFYEFTLKASAPFGSVAGAVFLDTPDLQPIDVYLDRGALTVLRSNRAITAKDQARGLSSNGLVLDPLPDGPLYPEASALPAGTYELGVEIRDFSPQVVETSAFHVVIQLGPDRLPLPVPGSASTRP
jgi:hypothetical protein